MASEDEGSKLHMIQRQQVKTDSKVDALCESLNRWAEASEKRAATLEKAIVNLQEEVRGQGEHSGLKTEVARMESRMNYLEDCNRKQASQLESIKMKVWMAAGAAGALGGGAGVLFSG